MTRIIDKFFFHIQHDVQYFHYIQVSGHMKANANFGVDKT
jgi:hypothetical protein